MKRVAIYLRVSTSKQETSNQRRELEAVAARSGWQIARSMRTPASAAPRAGTSVRGSMR
jgi:DNA invertase Pin-like site-specific DNA recombinase